MSIHNLSEFNEWTIERVKSTLFNRTDDNTINVALLLRREIQTAVNEVFDGQDYPEWLTENLTSIINAFIGLFKSAASLNGGTISSKVFALRSAVIYGIEIKDFLFVYTLPFLENYARTVNIKGYIVTVATTDKKVDEWITKLNKQVNDSIKKLNTQVDDSIKNSNTQVNAQIQPITDSLNKIKTDSVATLALLDEQAGKIGVKNYAEIFDGQAFEHSRFFAKEESGKYKFKGIGKAQWWLIFALAAFGLLIAYFTQLDKYFSLKDQYIFTPEVVVHIVGRFLLISLFIFIVSFCFKQFRINMHLYTLNKHRANTLKSFEYLTRAPDKLEASSYNAILMEVAKAIYESGQTGYININENSTDLPSIVDMSKVITHPKT